MIRALMELIVTIIIVIAARAILGSFLKSVSGAARSFEQRGFGGGYQPPPPGRGNQPKETMRVAGELHKDPVCGTYVAESTNFQRRSGGEVFYYCSEQCKEKHAVAAR
jgi:YHS domain-containing protein